MARRLLVGGTSSIMVGVGPLFPVVVERLETGALSNIGVVVLSMAVAFVGCGLAATLFGLRRWTGFSMPAPVRAVIMANLLFLSFCALETSDRLVRQEGRVFYWTSFLLVPTLLLLWGLACARRWAWWTARGATAVFVLWFMGFIVTIPFGDLRSHGVPAPWWGRLYMMGVSLMFASVSAYAFRALGHPDCRLYFRLHFRKRLAPRANK